MAVTVCALFVPVLIIGRWLRPLLAAGLQSLDRDVQISHGAKLGVQPLQFIPYSRPLEVIDHRREKQYGCAQAGKGGAPLMQRWWGAQACRPLVLGQNSQVAS